MADPSKPAKPFSLRQRVAQWLIPPLLVLLAINALLSYRAALDLANRAYDRSLSTSLKSIAESVHATGGQISVDIPYAAFDIFEGDIHERIFYTVIAPNGRSLTGYPDLRPAEGSIPEDIPVIRDTIFHDQPVRLATLTKRLYDPELIGGDTVTVLFAETTSARTSVALDLFKGNLNRQFLLLGTGLLLAMAALSSAFRPLVDLRDRIGRRPDRDLTPIPRDDVPSELGPLIDAINHHMQRLDIMLVARRRFLADAAHQIRTPLTVLGTQAEVGRRQTDTNEMQRTFASQLVTIRSARRMANQMLTLSRAEPANDMLAERAPLDLAELVRDVAGELAPIALKKHIDLTYDGPEAPLPMSGHAAMLREMISNLIDNALRYTPEHGQVAVGVGTNDTSALLRVVDTGPGIPQAEREKVFQRFYRILGQGDSEGSGLGLAIVREICWAHNGRISLANGENEKGLAVEIRMPLG